MHHAVVVYIKLTWPIQALRHGLTGAGCSIYHDSCGMSRKAWRVTEIASEG